MSNKVTLKLEGCEGFYSIYVDGQIWKTVHKSIISMKGACYCTEEEWQELEKKGAKTFALRRLAKKSYSSFELKVLLKRFLVSENIINSLIGEFVNKQYIDDNDWIKSFIQREIRSHASIKRIFAKLIRKGLSKEIIKKNLEKIYTFEVKSKILQNLINKSQNLDKQKIILKLLRKGFLYNDFYSLL